MKPKSREGSSYTRPRIMGKAVITCKDDLGNDRIYLKRWYLLRIPWFFSIRIHHILQPDIDRDPHDHPWPFISILLKGGYTEKWDTKERYIHFNRPGDRFSGTTIWSGKYKKVKHINFHTTKHVHQILHFSRPNGVWSLFLTGREGRVWGFQTRDGWIPWKEYMETHHAGPDPGTC
jgi:hypothetical protein